LKGSGELFKKGIWGFFMLVAITVLMAACSSESDEETSVKADDNTKKYAEIFEETDAIAHDFMVVKIEQNYPEILKYLTLDGIGKLKEKKTYLLDSHEYPNRFEELKDNYELRRYDNFYNDEKGEVYYRYRTPDDKDVLTNDWIVMEQDIDNQWKIKSYYGERPEMINDGNSETGTVLHELSEG